MGTRLFVGGLSSRVREEDLEDFFDGFGRIRDIVIKDRFGFVEFEDYRDAEDAVKELDGKSFHGERVGVEFARRPGEAGRREGRRVVGYRNQRRFSPERRPIRGGPPVRTNYRLIVENLSSAVSWQDLKDYMRKAGEVTYSDTHRDRPGEGVVEYATREDMERALDELDDMEIRGRRIRLVRDDRSKGESRSRSGSRSRSRSPRRRSSRSPTKSRSRSRSKSRSRSRSRGRDDSKHARGRQSRSKSRSRSKSASPKKRSRSASPKKRSRSASPRRRSQSRSVSKSPARRKSASRSRSKSRTKSRSRSRS